MKRNHGPFLVWTTREMVANAGLSGQNTGFTSTPSVDTYTAETARATRSPWCGRS